LFPQEKDSIKKQKLDDNKRKHRNEETASNHTQPERKEENISKTNKQKEML